VARTHRAQGQDGELKLAGEIAQDRAALIAMMKVLGIRSVPIKWVKASPFNRTSRKILVRLAATTTASSGLFSFGPLKWIARSGFRLGREKAARLKFNGRLLARSPLSDLEELELLRLGVEGKAAGWRALRALADTDSRLGPGHLDELMSRARRQTDLPEQLRVRVTGQVISS
jgi:hypothetical protein